MKVKIDNVNKNEKHIMVFCSSSVGDFMVEWIGDSPMIKKEYDIEFDIPEKLKWREDIILSNVDIGIYSTNNHVKIVAEFESLDEDGYTTVRVGDDIISVMSEGKPYNLGDRILLEATLAAYPVDY